jgi:nucleoside-diphosphate-sugar epimerase
MSQSLPKIAVLGASGLIGEAIALSLGKHGFPVLAVARRFTGTQSAAFDPALQLPLVSLQPDELARFLSSHEVDIVVNCIGVLQDSGQRGSVDEVHRGFIARLVEAMSVAGRARLLVHLSIPGRDDDDRTAFSISKRQAERVITASTVPSIILRPGFVIAPAAYGGSALIRALAALPVDLPEREASRPFATTNVADIAQTIAVAAQRWHDGEQDWKAVWDIMEHQPSTVGAVVDGFRHRFGGPAQRFRLPSWLMRLGAWGGDLASRLGWSPPIRSTALVEMRRGVEGDPEPWIAATGIEPTPLPESLAKLPATVQEKWFAQLYLCKPLILGTLALFWVASGLIALTVAFTAASDILIAHGFPPTVAAAITIVTGLADVAIGTAIVFRRTCRRGLMAGIGLSLFYMVSAALLAPSLWFEPLGALVKTGPAIVLMLVALAILDER